MCDVQQHLSRYEDMAVIVKRRWPVPLLGGSPMVNKNALIMVTTSSLPSLAHAIFCMGKR